MATSLNEQFLNTILLLAGTLLQLIITLCLYKSRKVAHRVKQLQSVGTSIPALESSIKLALNSHANRIETKTDELLHTLAGLGSRAIGVISKKDNVKLTKTHARMPSAPPLEPDLDMSKPVLTRV